MSSVLSYFCEKFNNKSLMDIIFVMIAVSILIAVIFFILFIKSVKSGQYDDMYTPSVRMLFEDEFVTDTSKNKKTKSKSIPKSINQNQ
ncbi:cbb3-type cytochrome oxidase assembly protein CcoS [Aureibaculum luteum]|uniref:cbb3-type cytochrome oxidase assembly protein CcoS n=1 Tax=Aureibaculum luteum TaxID=1548456 RepID=UPI002936F9C5|nr:cbb3-type cytochrome oxidase assembly protein CcoS [Aureibaculum luteum]